MLDQLLSPKVTLLLNPRAMSLENPILSLKVTLTPMLSLRAMLTLRVTPAPSPSLRATPVPSLTQNLVPRARVILKEKARST